MVEGPVDTRIGAEIQRSQEKTDQKKAQISALIRENMDAILAGTYTLENLLESLSGTYQTTLEALKSFLTTNFLSRSLISIAKDIRGREKILPSPTPKTPIEGSKFHPDYLGEELDKRARESMREDDQIRKGVIAALRAYYVKMLAEGRSLMSMSDIGKALVGFRKDRSISAPELTENELQSVRRRGWSSATSWKDILEAAGLPTGGLKKFKNRRARSPSKK
jgi:hypothetical protein